MKKIIIILLLFIAIISISEAQPLRIIGIDSVNCQVKKPYPKNTIFLDFQDNKMYKVNNRIQRYSTINSTPKEELSTFFSTNTNSIIIWNNTFNADSICYIDSVLIVENTAFIESKTFITDNNSTSFFYHKTFVTKGTTDINVSHIYTEIKNNTGYLVIRSKKENSNYLYFNVINLQKKNISVKTSLTINSN